MRSIRLSLLSLVLFLALFLAEAERDSLSRVTSLRSFRHEFHVERPRLADGGSRAIECPAGRGAMSWSYNRNRTLRASFIDSGTTSALMFESANPRRCSVLLPVDWSIDASERPLWVQRTAVRFRRITSDRREESVRYDLRTGLIVADRGDAPLRPEDPIID